MARRQARGQDSTRMQEVLDAAVQHFAEKGYQDASMQDIGESLGLLKGSIYYYVESKESLLFSVIQSVHAEMMENLEKAKSREGDIESRLRAFLDDMIELTINRPEHAGVFQRDFRHLSAEHQDEIRRERRRYEKFFEGLLTEGQREDVVRKDLNVRVMGIAGLTMITALPTWYRRNGSIGRRQVIDSYEALLMSAYRPS